MKEESDPGEILNSDDDAEGNSLYKKPCSNLIYHVFSELAEIEDEYDSFLDGFFERVRLL